MIRQNWVLGLFLVAGLLVARAASAQSGEGGAGEGNAHEERPAFGRMFRPHAPKSFRENLGLSEEQAQKLRRLRTEYEKEAIRKRADLRVAELDLRDLIGQKNAGLPQVEKKVQDVTAIRGELALLRVRNLMKAKEFLNDEQFARFRQMVLARNAHRNHPPRRGGMHSPWRMHHDGEHGYSEGEEHAG